MIAAPIAHRFRNQPDAHRMGPSRTRGVFGASDNCWAVAFGVSCVCVYIIYAHRYAESFVRVSRVVGNDDDDDDDGASMRKSLRATR